jgi:RimJ/RimL family protein N-acetyltransferase
MLWTPETAPVALVPDIPSQARDWRNHPAIWRWCRQHTLISLGEQVDWLAQIKDDPTIKMYGVQAGQKKSGPFTDIGVCGFTSIDLWRRSAEFSLYIAASHQGKNFGRKALALLIDHGFKDWGFRRIWGEVFDGNDAAMAVFRSLGFKHEGTLRQTYFIDGKWTDSHIISILDTDKRGPEAET